MARPAGAVEAVRVGLDQPADAIDHRGFTREGIPVASQHVEEWLTGHRSGDWEHRTCRGATLLIIKWGMREWERGIWSCDVLTFLSSPAQIGLDFFIKAVAEFAIIRQSSLCRGPNSCKFSYTHFSYGPTPLAVYSRSSK